MASRIHNLIFLCVINRNVLVKSSVVRSRKNRGRVQDGEEGAYPRGEHGCMEELEGGSSSAWGRDLLGHRRKEEARQHAYSPPGLLMTE